MLTSTVAKTGEVTSSTAAIPAALTAALDTAVLLTPIGTNDGTIEWDFALDNSLVQYLAVDETVTAIYTITLDDNSGTANATTTQDVTVVITGTNDAPLITDGPDNANLAETNAALTGTGTLTISDVDTTDVVVASVDSLLIGGTSDRLDPAAPTDAELKAMLTVTPTAILDGNENSDTLTWDFNSGAEYFNYLATGETLALTYMVKVVDDDTSPLSDTEAVTITITGTNDAPNITGLTSSNETVASAGTVGVPVTIDGTLFDIDTTDVHMVTVDWGEVSGGRRTKRRRSIASSRISAVTTIITTVARTVATTRRFRNSSLVATAKTISRVVGATTSSVVAAVTMTSMVETAWTS